MKALLKRLIGAHRPAVIAVVGATRQDVVAGIAHARTSGSGLPVWAWCAEAPPGTPDREGGEEPDCERFFAGATAARVRRDLGTVWPALTIVAWTGGRGSLALKLVPFTVPPFRIVIANEAGGFFAARPGPLAEHGRRRLRDASVSGGRRLGQWGWNYSLAGLAWLAQATTPLTRTALRLLRSGHAASRVEAGPCGAGFTEFAISGRAWPRRAVLQAALDSSAPFLVFRQVGETAPVEPLIALARETQAFAAARQIAYAGWRKTTVPRHPFRALQPGEATEVRAPWSTLLVVRRDLLLRLGVPRAGTFGAALLVLFWRAAAAGLRSLVAGDSAALTQEPAMALEDAEFACRLAGSRDLRALAPARPLRARGNVASSPWRRRPFRLGLPRVLVVSPYLPFPLSHGGAVRIYNLCRALSGEVDFVLACFREANEVVRYEELHEVFREVHVVDIDEKSDAASLPQQAAEYRNSAMAELIRERCGAGPAGASVDVVQLEYTQMATYADDAGHVPVILVEHDLTFTLYEQLANTFGTPAARRQYELWHAFERTALRRSGAVWTMSEDDQALALEEGAPRGRTLVVPNGVDLQKYRPEPRQTRERAVLFVGSFRHLPNLLAFETLHSTIMPLVWRVLPDVILQVIAGPHHERAATDAGKRALLAPDPRIRVQGFVEDVRPAYRDCAMAAIPLPVSAGTNIKVMEALACGRAVVSTAVGCRGLGLRDESDLLIREPGPAFADAILRLFEDAALRADLAARGRQTAESRFGWDAIGAGALRMYGDLLERDTEHAPESIGTAR